MSSRCWFWAGMDKHPDPAWVGVSRRGIAVEGHLLYASTNLDHDQAFRFRCAVDLASWRGFCPQRLVWTQLSA